MRRREVLATGAFALAAGVAGCTSTPPPPDEPFERLATSWPSVGYDPASTGNPPTGPGDGSRRWTRSRGATSELQYGILGTPLVAGERVYVATLADTRFDHSEYSNYLVALDASSGRQLWAVEFPRGLTGSPAVLGSTVVVGGRDRQLYGLRDGDVVWSVPRPGHVWTPTPYGDRVYVLDGTTTLAAVGRTGDTLWSTGLPERYGGLVGTDEQVPGGGPAADSRGVYTAVGTRDERDESARLRAHSHDGSLRWECELAGLEGGPPRGPAVGDGAVYATIGGTVHAVDASTGERQFEFATGYGTTGPPSTDGTHVYVAAKNLYALDPADGTERWRVVNESYRRAHDAVNGLPYLARPPVADGAVYLRTGAFDAGDGTRLWGDDADAWLENRDYYDDPYQYRPVAKPVVTSDALYASHTHHGVVKYA